MSSPPIDFENYRPLRRRALYARMALAAMAAVDLLAVFSDLREYFLLERLETEVVTVGGARGQRPAPTGRGGGPVVVFAFSAGFFIAWLHRAYGNLNSLGAQYPRYSRRTAIWSWFVPILNLWRPKQVINDVWWGSDPEAASRPGRHLAAG